VCRNYVTLLEISQIIIFYFRPEKRLVLHRNKMEHIRTPHTFYVEEGATPIIINKNALSIR
jgi:hypothetical protein